MSEQLPSIEDLAAELSDLRRRVQAVEDIEAIRAVITAYGPAVDAGDAEAVGRLWSAAAVYDLDLKVIEGREAIIDMVRTAPHTDYLAEGCGHLLDPMNVRVTGDTATATCHSMLLRRSAEEDSFWVWRVSANRFDMVREDGQWLIQRRTARLLDGSEAGRALLARAGRVG